MKVTIYELLGMVKDGKVPKKIKYEDRTYTLYLDEENNHYYQDDKCKYFMLSISCFEALNDEVEILEEEKKIPEKIDIYDELQSLLKDNNIDEHNLHKMLKKIELKQNEIIDYLKSKGE